MRGGDDYTWVNRELDAELLDVLVEDDGQPADRDDTQRRVTMQNNNGGWDEWASKVANETDDVTWLADPKEATRRTIARAGQQLAEQSHALARQDAFWVAQTTTAAQQLDAEFAAAYPDLMRTDAERHAVGLAVQKVMGDGRFMKGIQNPLTRPKALRAVAILASRELGRDDPDPARSAPAFLQSSVNVRSMDDGRNREALSEVIDHVRMTNRGFGG